VWLTGGVESLFTTLYVLPIVAASTVQLRRGGLQVATLSAILFIGVVVVQYGAPSTGTPLPIDAAAPRRDLPAISVALYTVGFNVFGFFAVALLSGSLAERAQRADVRLERATEQIADLQAFNQYVLDNLLSGLATADAQNRLLTFNRFAMVITGRTGALPIGESAVEVLQLPPEFTAALGDLGRVRTRRTDFEYRRADGRTIDLGLSVAALPLPDAGRGYLYTFQDVTETKRIERSARLQQRLAAIGEMAAGIAHEIRNPLASMSGSMQMLRQELPLSDDQAQLMDIVLKESERLNQTIKSFLAYARPQKLRPQALDLRTLVLETATLLRNSAEVRDTHTVEARAPETGVPMEGDESQIRQIIWNLATNGLRAMPDGGRLRLSALEETAADGQRLSVLEVADQGVGIPAEEIELVFQPFRGSFGRGTGLGLAIVHRLVTDNHGRIDVQSAPGRGTTFTIRFARLIGRDVPPPVGSASVLTSSA
jgi:two-component system sensor histidine kinase PilS (NtrC family)